MLATPLGTSYRRNDHGESARTLSTVPARTRLLAPRLHRSPVRTDSYEKEKLGVVSQPAVSEVTSSVETLCWVRLVRSRSLSEAENAESLICKIQSACIFLNRRALETDFGLARM